MIDRLTEQYNKNSLRNESYCLATNNTWMDGVASSTVKKLNFCRNDENRKSTLLEESNEKSHNSEVKVESLYSDPTYDSQSSLNESNCSNKFSRDAIGRQSMSEKRHAALDAKSTDTYKRNKKLREGRESMKSHQHPEQKNHSGKSIIKIGNFGQNSSKSSVDSKNTSQNSHLDCLYTIPGCNNKLVSSASPARKHWLVDDVHNYKEAPSGFLHSRGDFKQASLNSALDGKRTRKKSGLRSMLRLGKNRKSLNFGDNLDGRLEANTYCSGTINYIA